MKILIIDPDRVERSSAEKLLLGEKHEVRSAATPDAGLAMLEEFHPDVVLVDYEQGRLAGTDTVRRIRAGELVGHRYVIVTSAHAPPGSLKASFTAGADDFMRKPFQKDELIARVEAPMRIRRWAPRVLGAPGGDWALPGDVTKLVTWRSAVEAVTSEISSLFGVELVSTGFERALNGSALIAMLPLYLADDELEVQLYVGAEAASVNGLCAMMFGTTEASPEEARDVLSETANVAAGAIKRGLMNDGKVVTTGLPRTVELAACTAKTSIGRQEWIMTGADFTLRAMLHLGQHEPVMVSAKELREGMVLRADVRTAGGGLLLKRGTRLTQAHLPRLRDALGPTRLVEVADAA